MEQKVKALFAANQNGKQKAAEIANVYRKSGMEVLEITEHDFEKCQHMVKQQQATHLLYFHDTEQITMCIFAEDMDGFCVEIGVSDLQMP